MPPKRNSNVHKKENPKVVAGAAGINEHDEDEDSLIHDMLENLNNKHGETEHGKLALAVAKLVAPIITAAVSAASNLPTASSIRVKSAVRVNAYELDKLQQYGRKENIRISGIPEEEGEDLKAVIVKLGEDIGVTVQKNSINVAHRAGRKIGDKPRMVLCRFTSRDVKHDLLVKRAELKKNDSTKSVYVNEDLTPLRLKLLYKARSVEGVKAAYTREGIIHCQLHNGDHLTIESPDDLFKLGVDNLDYGELGLKHLDM